MAIGRRRPAEYVAQNRASYDTTKFVYQRFMTG